MLDPKVVEIINGLIQTQFAERRQRLPEGVSAASQRAAIGNSGMHVRQAVEICRREVEIRAWIVHNAHVRVLSELAVAHYPELSWDLKGRLSYFLSLEDDYALAPRELAKKLGILSHPDFRIHETRDHVLVKLGTEIDLLVERLARQKQQEKGSGEGSSVYHFHSPVDAFQTAPGSIANVVQNIGSHDKDALQEALVAVKEALSALSENVTFPKAEIMEMVDDAHLEVEKPAPNRFKLGSTLTTIGEAIRVMGALNNAYQSLKIAVLPYGITLP